MKGIAKFGLAVLGEAAVFGLACYGGAKKGIIDGLDGTPLYLREEKNDEDKSKEKKED